MSFYLNNNTPCKPGPIRNASCGSVCEKVCVEVTKVFDSCISQTQETGITLTATGFTPATYTEPLTFVNAQCTQTGVTLSDVVIDRLPDRPNFANVSATVNIPIVISYTDANGVAGTATTTLSLPKSACLFVPQPALTPVNITALAGCFSVRGSYSGTGVFVIDFCVTVILKVVADVDVLIPSYGYCRVPPCTECPTTSICPGFVNTPVFPTATV